MIDYEEKSKQTSFGRHSKIKVPTGFLIEQPYMTKYDLQDYQDDLLIDEYHNAYRNELQIIRTSGSTGKIVEVFWSKEDYLASNLCLWRLRKRFYNIQNSDYCLTFHSTMYKGTQAGDYRELEMLENNTSLSISKFSLSLDTFKKYAEKIRSLPVQWILTQPSTLLILTNIMKEYAIDVKTLFPQLRYIELNGEILFDGVRQMFENYFDVPVANLYGASEVNGIAYQCPRGHLHIVDRNVRVQLFHYRQVSDGVFEGDIAVTSLHNKVMPIISYALGDRVVVDNNVLCDYCQTPVINVLIGRSNDNISISETRRVSSYQLSYWIERVNAEIGNPVLEYKLKTNDANPVLYLYVRKEFKGWDNVIIRRLDNLIQEQEPSVKFEYICYDHPIELSSNGKVRSVE